MDRWKSRGGKSQRGEEQREKIREEKEWEEDVGARKDRKVAIHCVFPMWFVGSEGRKVGSPKWRVQGHLARWEMKSCTPLWREARLEVKKLKTPHVRTLWKLSCRKNARPCGAKHIWKSKCTKHTMFGPLFEVAMFKKCTPLLREAHFEVKM